MQNQASRNSKKGFDSVFYFLDKWITFIGEKK